MEQRFQDKVVLITGAAGGIGRAAALGFGAEGARIAVADANEVDGERTAALLREQGADAIFIKVDVSQGNSCAAWSGPPSRRSGGWTSLSTTPALPGPDLLNLFMF